MSTYLSSTSTWYICLSDCCWPMNLLKGRRKDEVSTGIIFVEGLVPMVAFFGPFGVAYSWKSETEI